MIEAYFDGCCEPKNPGGHAAWGAAVFVDGEKVYSEGGYCGVGAGMSNNVAEYTAAFHAFRIVEDIPGAAIIRGDSRLVCCQLSGEAAQACGYARQWRVKGGAYMPYYRKALAIWNKIKGRSSLVWISRDDNSICDDLSKNVLRDRGVVFKIQPEGE